ncbi:MAG: helix-turn-helix transcriptional regulator [Lachnospiraceae bacterium]|nr:helix-turn-helix transcriptional regulator [Lachnospiraceae bacterium]
MDWLSIGRNIKKKRLAKSWKQATLAERVDLSECYVGMIERGEKVPKLETLVHIVNALDSTSDEILEGVLNRGYEVRMSEYIKLIGNLPKEEQNEIFEVLDVMLKHRRKRKK